MLAVIYIGVSGQCPHHPTYYTYRYYQEEWRTDGQTDTSLIKMLKRVVERVKHCWQYVPNKCMYMHVCSRRFACLTGLTWQCGHELSYKNLDDFMHISDGCVLIALPVKSLTLVSCLTFPARLMAPTSHANVEHPNCMANREGPCSNWFLCESRQSLRYQSQQSPSSGQASLAGMKNQLTTCPELKRSGQIQGAN